MGRARAALIIIARPAGEGRYDALVDGRVLVRRSRQPLLDGARARLAEGVDPGTRLVMRHAGSEVDALLATSVGAAAKLTVQETDSGSRFRPWKAFPEAGGTVAGRAHVAPNEAALVGQPPEPANAPATTLRGAKP
jgi:hypothetical protein